MLKNKEASEQIYAEYSLGYGPSNVKIKSVNKSLLTEMINDSSKLRFIQESCEFYDDEEIENQTEANWIDIEGEGFGWVFLNYPARKWHKVMRLRMLSYIKELSKRIESGEELIAVVAKDKDVIIYTFIDREMSLYDMNYIFTNSKMY